jgi:hypothetical protein
MDGVRVWVMIYRSIPLPADSRASEGWTYPPASASEPAMQRGVDETLVASATKEFLDLA